MALFAASIALGPKGVGHFEIYDPEKNNRMHKIVKTMWKNSLKT